MQLQWHDLPTGEAVVRVGDAKRPISGRGPGAVVLDGLEPGRRYDVTVDGRITGRVRTLLPPPGEELCRFATVSDLHVGERGFGLWPRVREDAMATEAEAYPARCGRAALSEAAAWGAQLTVAKGDLTWSGRPLQWETVGAVLATSPVPVHATLGNHDVVPRGVDGREVLARYGVHIARSRPEMVDLPGLRLVIGHSADKDHRFGVIDAAQRVELVELVGSAPGPTFLTMHHYVNALPVRSRYPRGIDRTDGELLLRAIAAANPATFLSFGHTHRNRRRRHHGLPATEVGSTKDHPGVWAGYVVHEGGIRQVVRRIAEPSCIDWTERTAAVLGGAWGRWTPGRLSWRCFSWTWPC